MLPPPSIRGCRLSRGCVQGTAAYTMSMVQLTAVATPVIAVLNGPQGDVLSTNPHRVLLGVHRPRRGRHALQCPGKKQFHACLLGTAERAHCS